MDQRNPIVDVNIFLGVKINAGLKVFMRYWKMSFISLKSWKKPILIGYYQDIVRKRQLAENVLVFQLSKWKLRPIIVP